MKLIQSLKEGDPQAIAITSVLVFFGCACWFSWTLLMGNREEALPFGSSRNQAPQPTPTPLSAMIMEQQALDPGERPPNPFYKAAPRPRNPKPTPKPDKPRNPRQPRPKATPRPTPPEELPPPTPVPPETVTYLYAGVLTRPDGSTVAFVRRPKQGDALILKEGEALPPFTLLQIGKDNIEVQLGEDPPVLLQRGETNTFELP